MTIRVLAHGTVKREDREPFRRHIEQMIDAVREKEADTTLVYDFYLSEGDDDGNCVAHEAYVDAGALVKHFQTIAPYTAELGRLLKTTKLQFFGSVPAPLLDKLNAIAPVECHPETLAVL